MSDGNGQDAPKTYGLTRASTCKQVMSPEVQRDLIGRACEFLQLGAPQFLDEPLGTSGRSLKFRERPMGIWCLRNLKRGDTLVVTEIRTIGRNFMDTYSTVEALFNRGVRVVILKGFGNKILDLSDSADRILLMILAWAADEEAKRISERTSEAMQYRKSQGLAIGPHPFCYIQAYDADGNEIGPGQYDKTKGHFKRSLWDDQWLTQVCELLSLQKALKARSPFLYEYCKERDFVNRKGKRWWDGPLRHNKTRKSGYRNEIVVWLWVARRMAVAGTLSEEWNARVLAITGDTILDVMPTPRPWQRGKKKKVVDERAAWTLDDWQKAYLDNPDGPAPA